MKCLVIILFFSFSSIFAQEKFTELFELEIEKDFIQTKIANNELFLIQKLEKLATKKERLDTEDDMQEIFLISKSKRKLQDSIKVLNTTLLEKSQLIQRDIYKKILKFKKREKVKYKKIKAKSIEYLKSVKNDKQLDSYSKDQLEKERIQNEVEQKNFLIEQDKIKEAHRIKEVEDSLTLLKNLKAQELTLLKEKQDSLEIEKKATILKNRALLRELAKQDTLIEKQLEPTVEIVKENKLSDSEILEKMRLAKEKASQKNDTIVKNSDSTEVPIETKRMSVDELIAERAKLRHEERQAEKVKEEQIQEQLLIDNKKKEQKVLDKLIAKEKLKEQKLEGKRIRIQKLNEQKLKDKELKKLKLEAKKEQQISQQELRNQQSAELKTENLTDQDIIVSDVEDLDKKKKPKKKKKKLLVSSKKEINHNNKSLNRGQIDSSKIKKKEVLEIIEQETIVVETIEIDQIDLENAPLNKQDLADLKKMKLAKERARNNKDVKLVQQEKNNEIIFENKIDTSKVTKKEKETFIVTEAERIDTSIKRNIFVPKVVIKEQRKKKYSFGDKVDRNSSEKARFFLERAKLEIDKGNISKAKEYIDNSIKLNPSNEKAYILKGDIYASLNILEKAITQYHKASILDPNNAQLLYNLGNCFLQLGKDEYAIQEWTKAIAIDKDYIMAYVGRAALYLKELQYNSAIEDYDRIFRLNSYFYPAYRGRGVANLELGNYQLAIDDFNKYLEFEPAETFTITKRGLAKLYDNDIFGGCTDLLDAAEMGYDVAKKALKNHCEK